jgi:hypothetical protein
VALSVHRPGCLQQISSAVIRKLDRNW